MEDKIVGTVRQIEAGDELSGSIINPHPLLFNILKTPTAHSEQSSISVQHDYGRTLKISLMLKASAASEKDSETLSSLNPLFSTAFCSILACQNKKTKKNMRHC
ncbi:hypothetical protein CHARACLAT_002741 [Characodon lateralis]|uniref:Uncharacterized protein n=1 Tax=Characodon lateralis TaxID=208331 RepID=A0ABU7CJX6_9TELE|nr:hypothetical protein [Characodon lateralis]